MAEERINTLDDKFKKLLDIDGIKKPNFDISNIEDFKDFSIEELKNMKGEADSNDTLTEYDRLNIRRNIDNIIDAKEKAEKSKQIEDDGEKAKQIRQQIDEEGDRQKKKAEALSKLMLKMDDIIEQAKSGEIDDNTEKSWKDNYTLDELKLCKEVINNNELGLSEDEQKWLIKNLEKVITDIDPEEKKKVEEKEQLEDALADEFDNQIFQEGITINGNTYKLEYHANLTQNPERKGEFVWIKNSEVIRKASAETKTLPDNADGNFIKEEYYKLRGEYIQNNLKTKNTVEVDNNEKVNQNEAAEQNDKATLTQEEIDLLKNYFSEISGKNHDTLESLRTAKKSRDKKTIDQYKAQIAALTKERDSLKEKYGGKLPEFGGEITKLSTKAFEFKFLTKTKDEKLGVTRLAGPEIRIRHNILARHRINVTIRQLNKLGKELGPDPENNPDPKGVKKGVNYILNRSFLEDGGHIASAGRSIVNTFRIKTVADFDTQFGMQKRYIIENLKLRMKDNLGEADTKTIEAVEKRLDYYQAAYKRMFIRV